MERHLLNKFIPLSVLLSVYSFGTFGFFNLFNLRAEFQIAALSLTLITFFSVFLNRKVYLSTFLLIVTFFLLFGWGAYVHSTYASYLLEAANNACLFIVVLCLYPGERQKIANALLTITVILSVFIFICFTYYLFNEEIFSTLPNTLIYFSSTGSKPATPGFFLDWLSFTSGDGFRVFDIHFPRLKGYSNEPSTTLVHYFLPAILALLYSPKTTRSVFFILGVNMVCIASLSFQIILLSSLTLYFLYKFFPTITPVLLIVACITTLLSILFGTQIVVGVFEFLGNKFAYSFDLISRKIGSDPSNSSLFALLNGARDGWANLLSFPFGYDSNLLGTKAGLLYTVNSFSGLLGASILAVFWLRTAYLTHRAIRILKDYKAFVLGCCLFQVTFFYSLIIAGYGFERTPALLLLFLIYLSIRARVCVPMRRIEEYSLGA